jgi:transcriptional regulator with XRE-family HTH domain
MSSLIWHEDLGGRISDARRRVGLSQKGLAERLDISLWTLDQLESGQMNAAPYAEAISATTGLALNEFEASGVALPDRPSARRKARSARASTVGIRDLVGGRGVVLGSIALLVLIRFFTEVVPIVPRAANFIDIPIFVVIGLAAMAKATQRPGRTYMGVALPALIFLGICALSAMVNLARVEPGPALVFIYGFLAPLGVYAAVYRLWPAGYAVSLSRLIVALGVVQLLVVCVIDIPKFVASGNPDVISGTFGSNQYQLVFFLLLVIALLGGIFTIERRRRAARAAPVLVVLALAAIFLAQYRALLLTTGVSMVLIAALLSRRGRGLLASFFVLLSFAFTLQVVAIRFPGLGFATTLATFSSKPVYYASKKLGVTTDVLHLYTDHPSFVLTGSGPGTFSSRGWETFANVKSRSASNVQGRYVSALTGGSVYHTDVSDKYVLTEYRKQAPIQGSRQLNSPFFEYLSLLAEVGVPGFLAIVLIYVGATAKALRQAARQIRRARPNDPLPALLVACAVAFTALLQMGFLANWLEVTRVTFICWALFAITQKELESRAAE